MAIVAIGIDRAKNVIALHGVNDTGAVQLRQPKVKRAKLNEVVSALPPCTIGMEACTGAHHGASLFSAHGARARRSMSAGMSRIYFTDRDLGKQFPAILASAGLSVERHIDLFTEEGSDQEWLEHCGRDDRIAISHEVGAQRANPNGV